jgi:hypothetical protein
MFTRRVVVAAGATTSGTAFDLAPFTRTGTAEWRCTMHGNGRCTPSPSVHGEHALRCPLTTLGRNLVERTLAASFDLGQKQLVALAQLLARSHRHASGRSAG